MSIEGVDAAAFTVTNMIPANCGNGTIPIGGECQITVTFTPTTAGAKAAKLDILHNAPEGLSSVDLIGVGNGPAQWQRYQQP